MKWWWIFALVLGLFIKTQADAPSVVYGTLGVAALHEEFARHLHVHAEGKNLIGYLSFQKDYPIDESSYLYVKYALEFFKKQKVAFVIVHLDTLGGEVFPAMDIVNLFQKFDINEGISLVAFIDSYAVGVAPLLAYACRFIAITPNSLMGGQLPGNPDTLGIFSNELNDYLVNEYSAIASGYGRNPILAEAMIDKKIILVERNGQWLRLYDSSEIVTGGQGADSIISNSNDWLVLDASKLLQYGIADFEVHPEVGNLPAIFQEPYLSSISEPVVLSYKNWKIMLLMVMTHPAMLSVLLMMMVICLYLQIHINAWHWSGLVGVISMALLFCTSLVMKEISWIEGLMLFFGICLILLHMIIRTGANFLVWVGLIVITLAMASLSLPGFDIVRIVNFQTPIFATRSFLIRVVWLLSSLIIAIVIIRALKTVSYRYSSVNLPRLDKMTSLVDKQQEQLLPKEGAEGIAHCTLRPYGKVLIGDKIYDAISDNGKMIIKKTYIIVVKHDGSRLVVKEK